MGVKGTKGSRLEDGARVARRTVLAARGAPARRDGSVACSPGADAASEMMGAAGAAVACGGSVCARSFCAEGRRSRSDEAGLRGALA